MFKFDEIQQIKDILDEFLRLSVWVCDGLLIHVHDP